MRLHFTRSLKFALLAALLYIPLFGYLDTMPIRIWDEARLAINAYEMHTDGDLIVTHYLGEPEMWNTKPPLLIWFQVIMMKILGVNELAVRLPSAFAALFTCLVLLIFSIKYIKSFWFGFITIIILITADGYVGHHAARTGDYDTLLTLFTTLGGLIFFAYTETQKNKYLYLFFIATALAVLTKSVTGLLFLPALLIYVLARKQFFTLLKNKHFYFGLCCFIIPVLGYYLLREYKNPGYFDAVRYNELGGRYMNLDNVHKHGFWFYYKNLINLRFEAWYLLIPCGLVTGFAIRNKRINRITLFSLVMILTFFLVISTSQTKLEWYDVPLYPFLAIVVSVFIYFIYKVLGSFNWGDKWFKTNVIPFVFLFIILITPYRRIIDKTFLPEEYSWDKDFYTISYFLKDAVKGNRNVDNSYILFNGYNAHNLFYLNLLKEKGVKVWFKDWRKLEPGDTGIANQIEVKEYVETHYDCSVTPIKENIVSYYIKGVKSLNP